MFTLRARRSLRSSVTAFLLLFAALASVARAQETRAIPLSPPTPANLASDMDELKVLSEVAKMDESERADGFNAPRGFTGAFTTSTQYDSNGGWSSQLIPFMEYRFCRYFSMDVSTLLYLHIDVDSDVGTKTKPRYAYKPRNGAFGDTTLSIHGNTRALSTDYTGSFSLGLPSGNTEYGLGAGQVTYNINHRFEKPLRMFTPDVELGFGNTSSLIDPSILKNYISVGPMVHFQAGSSVDLPLRMNFAADAYEELPLDKNLVFSTSGSGKKKVTTSTNIDPAEDNGFILAWEIPLSHAITMTNFYSHSLRDHNDIAGFSFTFVLTAPQRPAGTLF